MNLSQAQLKKWVSSSTVLKGVLILGIVLTFSVFFGTNLHQELTLGAVKSHQSELQQLYAESPWLVVGGFLACYLPVIILNLPGAAVLGLAAGALFGTLVGTVLVSFASTIGATLACALSRYLLRDLVQRRFADKLKRVNTGLYEEGALYLFSLRLLPVMPFFIINLVMGLTTLRLTTFYWVSQLGMLPGTFLFVNAGNQLGLIDSPAEIISPNLLTALALIGLFPLITKRLLVWLRSSRVPSRQMHQAKTIPSVLSATLSNQLTEIENHCSECGACVRDCPFLSHYGTPKAIAAGLDFTQATAQAIAYECSLCGLCAAVCPEKLDPGRLFLDLRRAFVASGRFNKLTYRTILSYEKLGRSRLFSWQEIPGGCDTIFFPGCNLPGSRMKTTLRLFENLQRSIPRLGIV
ncbi:MAG: VTT domain-containing protein, partial [Desulfocapsaceae bacterium]